MEYYKHMLIFGALLVCLMISSSQSKILCTACRGRFNSQCHPNARSQFVKLQCDECAVFGRVHKQNGTLYEVVRDCANRIFPVPIPRRFANTCKSDSNLFIECTNTCTDGNFCADTLPYAPPGWRRDGSRDITTTTTTTVLPDTTATTTMVLPDNTSVGAIESTPRGDNNMSGNNGKTTPGSNETQPSTIIMEETTPSTSMENNTQSEISCVACRGTINSTCHLDPELLPLTLKCEKCAVFARISKQDGDLFEIVRDCAHRTFPVPVPARFENKCKDDNAHFIECTHTCTSGDLCSNSLSYAPPGWNEDGTQNFTIESAKVSGETSEMNESGNGGAEENNMVSNETNDGSGSNSSSGDSKNSAISHVMSYPVYMFTFYSLFVLYWQ